MKVKVKIVIFSHLSDVQEGFNCAYSWEENNERNKRINFVKWLIQKYLDLEVEIDPDKDYKEFLNFNKKRKNF